MIEPCHSVVNIMYIFISEDIYTNFKNYQNFYNYKYYKILYMYAQNLFDVKLLLLNLVV